MDSMTIMVVIWDPIEIVREGENQVHWNAQRPFFFGG